MDDYMTPVYQYRYRYQTGEWCGWRESQSSSARDSLAAELMDKGEQVETRDLYNTDQLHAYAAEALRQSQSLPAGAVAGLAEDRKFLVYRLEQMAQTPLNYESALVREAIAALQADAREKGEAVTVAAESHREAASIDAVVYGVGYLVDGQHVAPSRVEIIRGQSVPLATQPAQASEPDHDCSNPESPCFHPSHDEDDSKLVGAEAVAGKVNGYLFSQRAIEVIVDGEIPEWMSRQPGIRVTITPEGANQPAHTVEFFTPDMIRDLATQPAQASEKDRLAAMVEHGMAGVDWSSHKQPLHEADGSNPAEAVAWQFRVNAGGQWLEWAPCTENLFDEIVEFGENRRRPAQARALYTHPQPVTPAGGEVEPRTDRQMLLYLDYQFAGESWVCGRCGNEEPTNGCDSHIALQRHLYTSPTLAVDDAMIDRATAAFLKDNLVQRIVDRARMKAAIDAALNQRGGGV